MTVSYRGGRQELTKNETRILYCLMRKELCTRDELIEDLWQNSMYIDENTLYVNINRLREKLRQLGATDFIRTCLLYTSFVYSLKSVISLGFS